MDDKRKRDLEDVMREEKSRGRRPIDLQARRKRVEKLKDFRDLLSLATEDEFRKAMHDLGLTDGSPRFLEALRIWRGYGS